MAFPNPAPDTSATPANLFVLELLTAAAGLSAAVAALEKAGASVVSLERLSVTEGGSSYRLHLATLFPQHADNLVRTVREAAGVTVLAVNDPVLAVHAGGKISVESKVPVESTADLSLVYTPGVARICTMLAADPSLGSSLTIKGNMVAVITDGSAILGLGNLGPLAALPVMEGKAMIFKRFGGVDAFPLCLNTQDTEEVIRAVAAVAPVFGGINLEDTAPPRCFEIEERLQGMLDIPVFHDDQHGTAIVAVAAALNALKVVGKRLDSLRVVINGVGAAGVACAKMFLAMGVGDLIACDTQGAIYQGRVKNMNPVKEWLAARTNREGRQGNLADVLPGADLFLGVSVPGMLTPAMITTMARDPIIFAMSNPIPEILPEDAAPVAAVMATGRSDYPNQINNALAFPGVFRGALDVQARAINEPMKLAAVHALANLVDAKRLGPDFIVPSIFDERVVPAVSAAVAQAARDTGVARRTGPTATANGPVVLPVS